MFIYHVRCAGPTLASGALSQYTNAASYMDVSNYYENWFLRIVRSLCENCVLYFLLSHSSNKELFPMLTSLNGTFAAFLIRLPFFLFQFWISAESKQLCVVFPSSRCCTKRWLSNACLWKSNRNKWASYFNLDYTGCFWNGRLNFLFVFIEPKQRDNFVKTCGIGRFGSSLWPP